MKLYKLFEEVIFENVSMNQIEDAIKNKYNVHILYDDYPAANPSAPPSKRYISVYAVGDSKSGNKVIRAWQMGGPSKTTKGGAWKLFRVDRIRGWMPTKVKWNKAISDLYPYVPKYNKQGDRTMSRVDLLAQTPDMAAVAAATKPVPTAKKDDGITRLQQQSQMRHKQSSYVAKGNPNPVAQKPTVQKPVDTSKTTAQPTNKNKQKQEV